MYNFVRWRLTIFEIERLEKEYDKSFKIVFDTPRKLFEEKEKIPLILRGGWGGIRLCRNVGILFLGFNYNK